MTEIFVPENPPVMETEDGRKLAEYLYRQLLNVQYEFDTPKVGRGGLTLSNPVADSTVITQTPIKITGFDTQVLPQLYIESDVTESIVRILKTGLWFLAVKGIAGIVSHTSNITKGFIVELYNETKSQTYKVVDYGSISRYANTLDYTISIPVYVPVSVLGDNFAVYIYTTDANSITLTSINILDFDFVLLDDLLVLG